MDRQVGIAANRRGEVAVACRWPGRSALPPPGCRRPAAGCAARRSSRRAAPGWPATGQQLLQLEAALQAFDLEAELGDEFGQRLELARVGRLRARGAGSEARPCRISSATASLAASMNSSMIWWLSVFSTTWAAVTRPLLVQIDLHLLHRQLQRAAAQSAALAGSSPARACRPSSCVHLGRELAAPGLAIGQILVDLFVGEPPRALDRRRCAARPRRGRPRP